MKRRRKNKTGLILFNGNVYGYTMHVNKIHTKNL